MFSLSKRWYFFDQKNIILAHWSPSTFFHHLTIPSDTEIYQEKTWQNSIDLEKNMGGLGISFTKINDIFQLLPFVTLWYPHMQAIMSSEKVTHITITQKSHWAEEPGINDPPIFDPFFQGPTVMMDPFSSRGSVLPKAMEAKKRETWPIKQRQPGSSDRHFL